MERSFSWTGQNRRMSKDHERVPETGEPLRALSRLSPPVPVLHVYGQPPAPEYLSAQESFAWDHPWFAVRRVEAVSQFPTLEAPEETATVIGEFIR